MQFEFQENGRGVLIIQPTAGGRWDATPIFNQFLIDYVPIHRHPDRDAVVLTLLFGDYCAGTLQFPSRINAVTAAAITRYCSPAAVFIGDVDDGPKPILNGITRLRVRKSNQPLVREDLDQSDRELVLFPRSQHLGRMNWLRGMSVSANAELLDMEGPERAMLAAAVLVAQDFESASIELTSAYPNHVFWGKAADLLSSVGLGLTIRGLK
ncbi:hypothetical protein [Corynebacterium cystitidis]|uniref:Uncharacterized protein n=1 Tax=Corynebacterium cystitidis DSM 20524 TaxID=1121357 RepID=A0A1H9WB15_9CORY|nr:hypothetical protein [Corynebacterium cystitidis]WJY82942.1 hypothetical protein CCYS_10150 [Corynebacterium cystitidis DSM 20524]SES30857.1 hypothetical protein SAMN05661109_02623 [Corynebacterium cystitidis DSM 20524]SNV68786.1 Uncharacterised protein [Corynebacterium cystitidis]